MVVLSVGDRTNEVDGAGERARAIPADRDSCVLAGRA
jgi:hypothetical protein